MSLNTRYSCFFLNYANKCYYKPFKDRTPEAWLCCLITLFIISSIETTKNGILLLGSPQTLIGILLQHSLEVYQFDFAYSHWEFCYDKMQEKYAFIIFLMWFTKLHNILGGSGCPDAKNNAEQGLTMDLRTIKSLLMSLCLSSTV